MIQFFNKTNDNVEILLNGSQYLILPNSNVKIINDCFKCEVRLNTLIKSTSKLDIKDSFSAWSHFEAKTEYVFESIYNIEFFNNLDVCFNIKKQEFQVDKYSRLTRLILDDNILKNSNFHNLSNKKKVKKKIGLIYGFSNVDILWIPFLGVQLYEIIYFSIWDKISFNAFSVCTIFITIVLFLIGLCKGHEKYQSMTNEKFIHECFLNKVQPYTEPHNIEDEKEVEELLKNIDKIESKVKEIFRRR